MKSWYISLLLLVLVTACNSSDNQNADNSLGDLTFEATGSAAAQPSFMKGMLLLHSFEYEDAAEAFKEARTNDPGFAMAYWGEAMTYNHTLWQEQDFDKGLAVLNELAPSAEARIAKTHTELEKDFIRGVDILFGKGTKADRDSLYAAYMGSLYEKYPGNDEVAAFYSLSLIGWGNTIKNNSILDKAASIGFKVLQQNPKHPGALHYIIHAYDDPSFAGKALEAADKYAVVAPGAGHALHMPTHIYLAMGMWDKVVTSNIVSWKAEQERMYRKQLDNDAMGYHAYHWLQYGYLQQGDKTTAKSMIDSMELYCTQKPSSYARNHLIYLKTTYLAETDDYDGNVPDIAVENKDLNISTRCANWFVAGYGGYLRNDKEAIEAAIRSIAGAKLIEQDKASDDKIQVCGNVDRSIATKTDLQEASIMELELRALLAMLDKDDAGTEKHLKEAIALQLAHGPYSGPPDVVKPVNEMYAQWLLSKGRAGDAVSQFKQALLLAPNRLLAKKGLAEAETLVKATAYSN